MQRRLNYLTNLLRNDRLNLAHKGAFRTSKTRRKIMHNTLAHKKEGHIFHELKRHLRSFGLVNITGLQWVETMHGDEGFVQASRKTLCRWSHSNHITIAVLENGEIRMRYGEIDPTFSHFLRKICPKGSGAVTNLPDAFVIDSLHILDRANNAYSPTFGDPIPKPF